MALHKKIQELKGRSAPITMRAMSVNDMGQLTERESLLDQGIVEGYLLAWGQPNLYGEKFIKGCCAKSIKERGPGSNANYEIKFLNQHDQCDPLSLFDVLKEDDYGLYFRTKKLDDVDSAKRVITQLKSRTLNNFSIGFDYVWDKIEYDSADDTLVMLEINLFEGSVVSIPADLNTYAIRSIEEMEDLHDEIDHFIKDLPRSKQMEARNLFARQKSLIDFEPLKTRAAALKNGNEPTETGIDYSYLTQNFKF